MSSMEDYDDAWSFDDDALSFLDDEEFAEQLQLEEAILASIIAMEDNMNSSEALWCTICTDTKSEDEMFTIEGCSHSFCADCISQHIAAKLEHYAAVRCPEPKCAVVLEPEMCGSLVSKEVLEQWGDVLLEAMLGKTKRIYCPFEECSWVMVDDGEEAVTAAECPSCWRMFWAQCEVGWHEDMECEEFEELRKELGGGDREDVMTLKLAHNNKWKRCSECNIYVDKIDGCLHITCMCGSEFCYSCGSKWSSGHACT